MATNDELVKDMVVNLLSGADVYKVKYFKMGSIHLHPVLFTQLLVLIQFDKVKFKFVAAASGGVYESGSNTFEFGYTTASTLPQKALILHEATHALLDIMIAPGMKVADSEAMAYIVQCQYAQANNTVPGTRLVGRRVGDPQDRVFSAAWKIAKKILANRQPKDADYNKLKKAISKEPKYRSNFRDPVNWDGI
jgi:hypothetical protein